MHATRLVALLLRLQSRGRLTASNMADELDVSVRTIYRDIDQLSAAGIPVVADRGCKGGFKLLDGFRTQLGALTEAEAEALFLAALPGPAADLGMADLMEAARLKLSSALPGGAKSERFGTRFHLDVKGWFRAGEQAGLLPTIAQAVRRSRFLKIRYASDRHAAARKVGPAGLVLKGGVWYLVAQTGESFRTYRVARISTAEVLEVPYVRPPRFDLPAHWARTSRDFEIASYRASAVVRLSPRGLSLLEILGPYVVEAVTKSAGQPDRQGWVRCTLPIENEDFGIRELMRLGEEVQVMSPPALRAQVARTLRRTLRHYLRVR
jgi:predicted DNA-binding transcriptional regulator YafY